MSDENVRERDKMWQRIDENARRIDGVDKRTVAVEGKVQEHGRQLSDMSSGVSDLHQSMNQMIGGMRSLRWVAIGLGALIALIQIADAISGLS